METLTFCIKIFLKVVGIAVVGSSGINNQSVKPQVDPKKSEPIEIVYQKQDTVLKDTLNINMNTTARCIELDDIEIQKIS